MSPPILVSANDLFVLRVAAGRWLKSNGLDSNAKQVEQALLNTQAPEITPKRKNK